MCQRITCKSCGRPSFSGCGRHVESVLGDVPAAERCQCGATKTKAPACDVAGFGFVEWLAGMLRSRDGRREP